MKKFILIMSIFFLLMCTASCRKFQIIRGNNDATIETEHPVADMPVKNDYSLTYILNKNTMKFHHPQCYSVKSMKEKK